MAGAGSRRTPWIGWPSCLAWLSRRRRNRRGKGRTDPMASLRKRGKNWYFRYTDADGVKREGKGCSDKRATQEMANAAEAEAGKIRSGMIDPKSAAYGA